MSETLVLSYKNYAKLRIDSTDGGILHELQEHFSFYATGYKYMPQYKSGMWDGKIRLFDMRTQTLPAGLLHAVKEFAANRSRNYNLVLENNNYFGTVGSIDNVSFDDFHEFIQGLNLTAGGKRIQPREYQIKSAYEAITNYRKLILSPTGTGKSLIMYMIMRWVLHCQDGERFVIIVPTTTLTHQLISDFEDYSSIDEDFVVEDMCYPIFSGQDKKAPHQVIVSTWQSLAKFDRTWLMEVGGVIGDEAHTCSAKICQGILDKMTNAQYRIGTTGTLDGTKVHEMVLEGIFGPTYTATTTKEQIDEGNLAKLQIKVMKLQYPEDERRLAKFKYQDEVQFIAKHEKRNRFVAKLALSTEGNTLVMFRFKEHGQMLYDMIKEKAGQNRKVFLVHGEIDGAYRNEIRGVVEGEQNAIIVASIGTFSTGINIKNLHNLVFATPHKGRIKVLQSLGRALRKSTDGRETIMYDICDDLHWKKRKNFALIHSIERIKQYSAEKLDYKIYDLKI